MSENNNNEELHKESGEYEDVCYICRRPEHTAGRMIRIQAGICICRDCMQKTFDSMNSGGINFSDMLNMNNINMEKMPKMPNMPNISMINLSDLAGGIR